MRRNFSLAFALICGLTNSHLAAQDLQLPKGGINLSSYVRWSSSLPTTEFARRSERWGWYSWNGATNTGTCADGREVGWPCLNRMLEVPVDESGYPAVLNNVLARTSPFGGDGVNYPVGHYRLQWTGEGGVNISPANGVAMLQSGSAGNGDNRQNWAVYNIGAATVAAPRNPEFEISSVPVGNLSFRYEGAAGQAIPNGYADYSNEPKFNQHFLDTLSNYGVIRFMDWNETNGNVTSEWSDRTLPSSALWGRRDYGVPYELQIDLCNEANKDCWINVPHLATDDYVRQLADLVKTRLNANLRVWLELSNESWNNAPDFTQRVHFQNLRTEYGVATRGEAYGRRSAEIFKTFAEEFTSGDGAADADRLIPVLAGRAANSQYLTDSINGLNAAGGQAKVAAIAPYVALHRRDRSNTPIEDYDDIHPDTGQAFDMMDLYSEYLETGQIDIAHLTTELLADLEASSERWEENALVATNHGIPLVAYEAGQHLVPRILRRRTPASLWPNTTWQDGAYVKYFPDWAVAENEGRYPPFPNWAQYLEHRHGNAEADGRIDERFIELLGDYNRSPQMVQIYETLLAKWEEIGGETIVFFNDIGQRSDNGFWGLMESYNDTNAPKFQAVQQYLTTP